MRKELYSDEEHTRDDGEMTEATSDGGGGLPNRLLTAFEVAEYGTYQPNIQTAWETLRLLANGIDPKPGREGGQWNREQLERIDLRWHDLRHEGACRLLADRVDIRIIQLMLGHASIQQTQRYLNVTDEELRRGLEVSWKNEGRPLRLASGS